MPYKTLSQLPDSVKNNLPKHAQEIYKSAFNHAWDEYKHPKDRMDTSTREKTSHRVAWAAVKRDYKKNEQGKWIAK